MGTDQTIRPINFRDVAERIMSTIPLFVMEDDNTFYVYKDGVYVSEGAEPLLNRKIRATADEMNIERGFPPAPVNRRFIAEVLDYIRVYKTLPRGTIGANDNILNLKNVLLNLNTMEFAEHTSEHYSIVQYPVRYEPGAKCPEIKKFLSEVVLPGDLETLMEYTGYSLIPGNSFKTLAILYGGRDAGKSTYCNLIESLFGSQYVAHVSPQMIQENKFAQSQLFGKVLNIVPDIGDKPLAGTEAIKSLIGNDVVSADQKYKNSIKFVNKSHIFWGANKAPDIKNDDLDFYDKVQMINFPHCFSGSKGDRSLINRITTDQELSGFLNLLIAARKTLLERGRFSGTETGIDARGRYRMQSNPVDMFLEEHITASVNDMPKIEMYSHYQKWCTLNSIKPLPVNLFGKKLKSSGFTDSRYRFNSELRYVWVEVAYAAKKPTIQARLPATSSDVPGNRVRSGLSLPTQYIDTGEGDAEKDNVFRVFHVISSKLDKEKEYNVYREMLEQKNGLTRNSMTDNDFSQGSKIEPGTGADFATRITPMNPEQEQISLLRSDLVNFVKVNFAGFLVEDVPAMVDSFCSKWPGYRNDPGPEYIYQLAEILKSRGWK